MIFSISHRRWSRIQGTAVNCTRWVSSCRHTQSRKSWGSTCELALDLDDVRRDEQQPPGRARRLVERVELAEHLAAHEPEQRPSSAPVTREPTACANADGAPFLAWSLSISGLTISAKPSAFAWSQPRPVDDEDGCGALLGDEAGEPADQRGRPLGPGAQLGDHVVGLGPADRRALPGEASADADREVPVDHRGVARSCH